MREIKYILRGLLRKDPEKSRRFIRYCKRLAHAYLRQKIKRGDEFILLFAGSLEDLAWDCIADLFERDEKGSFVQIEQYLENKEITDLPESYLQSKVRRLVFSQVNDALFRNYGSFDSSLHKIIRNIKRAIGEENTILITSKADGKWIVFDEVENDLPIMPPEMLKIRLFPRLKEVTLIPETIGILDKVFRTQNQYRPSYPLVQVALIIRSVYATKNELPDRNRKQHSKPVVDFLNGELEHFLDQIINKNINRFHDSYVKSGKMSNEQLTKYLEVVREIIRDTLITTDPDAHSNYEHFRKHFDGISQSDYREYHRQFVEYFTRKTRKELVNELKKEL